ncbi:hypothetical protein DY000_02005410 [Brassica cretica]|uniref:UVR domain-containing protein n=1 Tax=Brassica cretica TaxID=69181 RepID=A0ABQ7BTR2_BRACR|nr:hypothetical protein DY000_02005410 [Brassica cretica]
MASSGKEILSLIFYRICNPKRSDYEEITEARAEAERKGFEAELKRLRTILEYKTGYIDTQALIWYQSDEIRVSRFVFFYLSFVILRFFAQIRFRFDSIFTIDVMSLSLSVIIFIDLLFLEFFAIYHFFSVVLAILLSLSCQIPWRPFGFRFPIPNFMASSGKEILSLIFYRICNPKRSDYEEITEARAEAERKGFEAELKRLRTILEYKTGYIDS